MHSENELIFYESSSVTNVIYNEARGSEKQNFS